MNGALTFDMPWLLAASALLPLLWLILRVTPPATRKLVFPAASLLAGIGELRPKSARTPFWLLLLRMAAIALLVIGFSGPNWRINAGIGAGLDGAEAVLIVMDAGWPAAPDWQARQRKAVDIAQSAGSRPVGILFADDTHAGPVTYGTSAEAIRRIRAARPVAWRSGLPAPAADILSLTPQSGLASFWLSDAVENRADAAWVPVLQQRGSFAVIDFRQATYRLSLDAGAGRVPVLEVTRFGGDPAAPPPEVLAIGPDPQGTERVLSRIPLGQPAIADTGAGGGAALRWSAPVDLPIEIRNRIRRFEIEGIASSGAVALADTRTSRPKIAITGHFAPDEAPRLLDPAHYLRNATEGFSDIVEGTITEVLQTAPDVVVLIDSVLPADEAQLTRWVQDGGRLIRFSGPRMAVSTALADDPLLAVRLLPSGRETGGALSWGEPQSLAPWPDGSPFSGLPGRPLAVRAQLVAEPGPDLGAHVVAMLEDTTPLVTRRSIGKGQVVFFHVTADPAWSDLPLSGMFPDILQRLILPAAGAGAFALVERDVPGNVPSTGFWRPGHFLDGWGRLGPAPDIAEPVMASRFEGATGPDLQPGLYEGEGHVRAVNAGNEAVLPASWPAGVMQVTDDAGSGYQFGGWFIWLGAMLFAMDVLASAALAGGLRRKKVTG